MNIIETYCIEYLTPKNPTERGSQLSIRFSKNVGVVFEELEKRGVVVSTKNANNFDQNLFKIKFSKSVISVNQMYFDFRHVLFIMISVKFFALAKF